MLFKGMNTTITRSTIVIPFRNERSKQNEYLHKIKTGIEFDIKTIKHITGNPVSVIKPNYTIETESKKEEDIENIVRTRNIVSYDIKENLDINTGLLIVTGAELDQRIFQPQFLFDILSGKYSNPETQNQEYTDTEVEAEIATQFSRCRTNKTKFTNTAKDFTKRVNQTKKIIKEALRRGIPVLAICAGTLILRQAIAEHLNKPAKPFIRECKDHTTEGMPSLRINGEVGNLQLSHYVEVSEGSLLRTIVTQNSFKANSCHWFAMEPSCFGEEYGVELCAVSGAKAEGSNIAKHPEDDVVDEAFEMPDEFVLGVQWHPEAFANDNTPNGYLNTEIIRKMAKIGDFLARSRIRRAKLVLQALKNQYNARVQARLNTNQQVDHQ